MAAGRKTFLLFLTLAVAGSFFLQGCKKEEVKTDESAATTETTVLNPEKGTWTLEAESSTLTYQASRLAATPHTGTVALKEGTLLANETGFSGGEFVIDMTQITEAKNNEKFLSHIKSDDFFSVEKFPTARFLITKITSDGDNLYGVTGDLTIKDKTNSITFPAMLAGDGNRLSITAKFEIDRTKWDITFDSGSIFQNLGDRAIKDEIQFDLALAFRSGGSN